ncbi:MAG: V-type ATP synthase subunit D [Gammaproteobacteria bacterium]|nr:V-type ATP synthase subunit D [Gammaproteobacteria bacterium]
MPELSHATTASRSALLEIKDELQLVNDGYEFLDEKRILLAAELLRQRDEWRERQEVFMERWRVARDALVAAAADQGLQGLEVAPPIVLPDARIEVRTRPYVGQVLIEASFVPGEQEQSRAALRPTPQLAACREAFAELIVAAATMAASTASLARLLHEYRRTERRVRALENVVLPEIHLDIATMEEHLELVEQEEVIRVRTLRPGRV